MACPTWECILVDWINCLKLSTPIECLEDLADSVFFNNLRKLLKKSSDITNADDLTFVFELLSRHYPNIDIKNKSSIHIIDLPHHDLIRTISLLLHYTCIHDRRNVLTSPMCHNLSSIVQQYIKQFLEKTASSVNNSELDSIIKNLVQDNNKILKPVSAVCVFDKGDCSKNLFSSNISPLQDILKTPAASKNIKLFTKDKEIERLKSELDMEKTEKVDLCKELNDIKLIVNKLEMKLSQKISEINRLNCEIETIQCNDEQSQNVSKQNDDNRKLLKIEIENLELYIKQLENEENQMQIERDQTQIKLKKLETDSVMWQEKFFEIEEKFQYHFDLSEEFRKQNDELKQHCNELQSFLEEYRSGSLTRSFEESCIGNVSKRRSSGSNFGAGNVDQEDLAHTVIDLQLKETEKKLDETIEQLETVMDEKIEIIEQLTSCQQQIETDKTNYEKIIDELKVEMEETRKDKTKQLEIANENCNNLAKKHEALFAKFTNKEKELNEIEENFKKQINEMEKSLQNININLELTSEKLDNSEYNLNRMTNELHNALAEINLKQEEIEKLNEDIGKLTEKNVELERIINGSRDENKYLKDCIEKNMRQVEATGEKLCNTEYSLNKTTIELSCARAEINQKAEVIEELKEKLTAENAEFEKIISLSRDENKQLKDHMEKTMRQVEVTGEKLCNTEYTLNKTISELNGARVEINLKQEEIEKINENIGKLTEKNVEFEKIISLSRDENKQLKDHIEKTMRQVEVTVEKLCNTEYTLNKTISELNSAQAEINQKAELIEKLTGENAEFEKIISMSRDENKQLKDHIEKTMRQVEVTGEKLCNTEYTLNKMVSELNGARVEINLKQEEIEKINENIGKLTEKNIEFEKIISLSRDENKQLKDHIEKTVRQVEVTGEKLCNTEYTLNKRISELNSAQAEINQKAELIEKLTAENAEFEKIISLSRDENKQLKDHIEKTVRQVEVTGEKLCNTEYTLNKTISELNSAQAEINQKAEIIEKLTAENTEFEKIISLSRDENKQLKDHMEKTMRQVEVTGEKLCNTEYTLNKMVSELNGARAEIYLKQEEIEKIYENIGKLTEKNVEFEKIISLSRDENKQLKDHIEKTVRQVEVTGEKLCNTEYTLNKTISELNSAQAEINQKAELIEKLTAENTEFEKIISLSRDENKQLKDHIEKTVRQVEVTGEKLCNTEYTLNKTISKLNSAQAEINQKAEIIEKLTAENTEFEKIISLSRDENKQLKDHIEKTVRQVEVTGEKLCKTEYTLNKTISELNSTQAEINQKAELIEKLTAENTEFEKIISLSRDENKQLKDHIEKTVRQVEVTGEKLCNTEYTLNKTISELNSAQAEINQKAELIEKLTAENTEFEKIISLSRDENKQLKDHIEKTVRQVEVTGEKLCNTEYTLNKMVSELNGARAEIYLKQEEIEKLIGNSEELIDKNTQQEATIKLLSDENQFLNNHVKNTIKDLKIICDKFIASKIFFNNRFSYVSLKCSNLVKTFAKVKGELTNKADEEKIKFEEIIKENQDAIKELQEKNKQEMLNTEEIERELKMNVDEIKRYKKNEEKQRKEFNGNVDELNIINEELILKNKEFGTVQKVKEDIQKEQNETTELLRKIEETNKVLIQERNDYYRKLENSVVELQNTKEQLQIKLEQEEINTNIIKVYKDKEQEQEKHLKKTAEILEEKENKIRLISVENQQIVADLNEINSRLKNELESTKQSLNKLIDEKLILSNFLELNSSELTNTIQQKDELLEALEMSNKDTLQLQQDNEENREKLFESEQTCEKLHEMLKNQSQQMDKAAEKFSVEKQEMQREFEKSYEKYENEIKELQIELANEIEKLATREEELEKAGKEYNELHEKLAETEMLLGHFERENKAVSDESSQYHENFNQTVDQLRKIEEELQKKSEQEEANVNKLKMYEEIEQEWQKQLKETIKQLEEKEQNIQLISIDLDSKSCEVKKLEIGTKEMENQLLETSELVKKLKEENNTVNKERNEYFNQLRTVEERLAKSLNEITIKMATIERQSGEIDKINENLKQKDEEIVKLSNENHLIVKDFNETRVQLKTSLNELEILRKKCEKLTEANNEVSSDKKILLANKGMILNDYQIVLNERDNLIKQLNEQSINLERIKEDNSTILNNYEDRQRRYENDIKELTNRLNTMKQMNDEKLMRNNEEYEKKLEELRAAYEKMSEQLEKATLKTNIIEGQLQNLSMEKQEIELEKNQLNVSLELQKKEMEKLENEHKDLLKSQTEIMKQTEQRNHSERDKLLEKLNELEKERNEIREKYENLFVNISKSEMENINLRQIIEERNEKIQQFSNIKQAYEKLLEENNKYITEIDTVQYKRSKDREEYLELLTKERQQAELQQQRKIMEIVTDNENKLEKMKEKMLKVYREQVESIKNEQADVNGLQNTIDELKQQLSMAQRKIERLELANREHCSSRESVFNIMDKPSSVTSLRGKGNKVADRDSISLYTNSNLRAKLASTDKLPSTINDRMFRDKIASYPSRSRTATITNENLPTSSRKSSVNDIGKNLKMEDEDENMFNPKYLTDLKQGHCTLSLGRESSHPSRMSELAWRNSMVLPHLKSSYPAETQFISPRKFKEEDLKLGNVDLDDSHSKLLPNDKQQQQQQIRQKKDFGTTSYKKPGPPTPSKHAGRMSLQGNEISTFQAPVAPLKDINVTSSTPKRLTPSRIRSMFTSRKDNAENITPRTTGRYSFFKMRKN